MEFLLTFKVNDWIYIRDPETSEIGKQIVKHAIELIHKIGFEQFTFKKLAVEIESTEATIYRYFENKHRLLLYILNWYWSYMEFLVMFKLKNMTNKKEKLKCIIELLTNDLQNATGNSVYNNKYLSSIVITESSKVYLVKDVSEINKNEVFKPYKELCEMMAVVIKEYNPKYKYARSLASTIVETSHQQQFFSKNLPRLTDNNGKSDSEYTCTFLLDLIFKILD